jgi:hypothetical protein
VEWTVPPPQLHPPHHFEPPQETCCSVTSQREVTRTLTGVRYVPAPFHDDLCERSKIPCYRYLSNRLQAVKWFWQPQQRCSALDALSLNMPHPDFEDDILAGQRVIQIKRHGIHMDGVNLERD